MPEVSDNFKALVNAYVDAHIEFPGLRTVTIAQWLLESGRGQSQLAVRYNNYAGLKYRNEMAGYATPIEYEANDGGDTYCNFPSLTQFILGYWRFLDRAPYAGWRNHANDATQFIKFIGPIYTPTALYADTVINLIPEAQALLDDAAPTPVNGNNKPPGTSEEPKKPIISRFVQSPNFSSRNGERIRRIILHCTTSRSLDGSISWFQDPISQVSAHYVIGRDGTIVQMVRDGDKAWHAKNANIDSIGIEHSGEAGDQLTDAQKDASVSLICRLLVEYKLPKRRYMDINLRQKTRGRLPVPIIYSVMTQKRR